MNTYSYRKSIVSVLLICCVILSMFAVSTMIDARQKKRRSVSPSGEVNTWWDDLTDAMDVEELVEKILKSIGALKKDKADLEADKRLQQANALRSDKNAKSWEKKKNASYKLYLESYGRHSAASTAINLANYTITTATEDIAKANKMLDAIYRNYRSFPDSSTFLEAVAKEEAKKEEAISKKDAAKADIPTQEAIIETEEKLMPRLWKAYLRCDGMIKHSNDREDYHDKKIGIINQKIAAIDAQIQAEEDAIEKLNSDYDSKDADEQAGLGESPGLSHTSSDNTIDLGETHSFKAITDVPYYEVNWYIRKKSETGVGNWLYANSGGSNVNKAEIDYAFSTSNGITPYTDYVLTARVTRYSGRTTYDLTYNISIGP